MALLALLALLALMACDRDDPAPASAAHKSSVGGARTPASVAAQVSTAAWGARLLYSGHDARGIPYYTHLVFDSTERALLRRAFGIDDPSRLYESDSTPGAILKYDTRAKPCRTCYVNSYDVGFISVRRPGESWEAVEQRVKHTKPSAFTANRHTHSTSIDALDPSVQPIVRQMLLDARRAGFSLRVSATYRSPTEEAFLMAKSGGRTHTLTSMHSYGRALDVLVGDGVPEHRRTKRQWIAFRRWVTAYHGGVFRILGAPDHTWDWAHVEVPSPQLGFHDIDAALATARSCLAHSDRPGAPRPACEFVQQIPASDSSPN